MDISIELLREEDIPQALELIRQDYSDAYAGYAKPELEAMFREGINPPEYVVARLDGKLVGLAGYSNSMMDWSVYEMFWVDVAPEVRHKGIGSALVKSALEHIKTKPAKAPVAAVVLTTRKVEFWRKLGFEVIAPLFNSYVVMMLKVEDARKFDMPDGYMGSAN